MKQEQLFAEILSDRPSAGDVVYIERRGEEYAWRRTAADANALVLDAETLPDARICYSGEWPLDDPERWHVLCDDLIAKMESMAGGPDRCRWSADDPWPRGH